MTNGRLHERDVSTRGHAIVQSHRPDYPSVLRSCSTFQDDDSLEQARITEELCVNDCGLLPISTAVL